jgi:murein DD-endopeptidase MepM/ murein hydrolase activator NlpD
LLKFAKRKMMRSLFLIATTAVSIGVWSSAFSQQSLGTKTGSDLHARTAIYPDGMACGRITSFFGSMIDLDGTRRKMAHTGIDLGNLGDGLIAPADGRVEAIWAVSHDYGTDWNLLLAHTPKQLNLPTRPVVYYVEFDHLQLRDMLHLKVGDRLKRGDPIGVVHSPGDNDRFRAEVHMEIFEIPEAKLSGTKWHNESDFKYWYNEAAQLVDPLNMLTLQPRSEPNIELFSPKADFGTFAGFVYLIRCTGQ